MYPDYKDLLSVFQSHGVRSDRFRGRYNSSMLVDLTVENYAVVEKVRVWQTLF